MNRGKGNIKQVFQDVSFTCSLLGIFNVKLRASSYICIPCGEDSVMSFVHEFGYLPKTSHNCICIHVFTSHWFGYCHQTLSVLTFSTSLGVNNSVALLFGRVILQKLVVKWSWVARMPITVTECYHQVLSHICVTTLRSLLEAKLEFLQEELVFFLVVKGRNDNI